MRYSILFFLIVVLVSCDNVTHPSQKINLSDVSSIEILLATNPPDPLVYPRKLKVLYWSMLDSIWNNSINTENKKIFPTYYIRINMHGDSSREFKISKNFIWEDGNDTVFSFKQVDLMSIWEQNKPICPFGDSDNIIPISYGLPTMDAIAAKKNGQLLIGDCMESDTMPHWYCKMHEIKFNQLK